ncbi:MAG TPA: hypothetical protein VFH80_23625 [Solirubrobacteraceae bacterium]|nr:hypothetical protein [Solirubrobacteraceae bacterium]
MQNTDRQPPPVSEFMLAVGRAMSEAVEQVKAAHVEFGRQVARKMNERAS